MRKRRIKVTDRQRERDKIRKKESKENRSSSQIDLIQDGKRDKKDKRVDKLTSTIR